MTVDENTPLLQEHLKASKTPRVSAANRILVAGFLISVALSFTQVPILYVFRQMECEEFYKHHIFDNAPDRCKRTEIDSGTAAQISILGLSTTFCGVLNLFFAGWQIGRWGPRRALVLQTAFPALRVAVQVVGVTVGAREGIVIVQLSQIISLIGGMSGYLLVLNTAAGEVVEPSERTAMFGMLQGSVMLGTAAGYLVGGIISDAYGVRRPFEIATVVFSLSSLYSMFFIPYIDPKSLHEGAKETKQPRWSKFLGGLKVLCPKRLRLSNGRAITHYGITFLALGVFMGVLATGYAPMLIQIYATAAFNFLPTENGYLMATNSLIRGFFLLILFPKTINAGRAWFSSKQDGHMEVVGSVRESSDDIVGPQGQARDSPGPCSQRGRDFDIFFLRWSLVFDGLVTASTAFATKGWHIYLAGFLLPLASGSAPTSKGVVTEMCLPSERAEALQAMTLVENVAMLSTLGLFGFIFSSFSIIGKAYLTFYCNAAVALAAVGVLLFSHFPPSGSKLEVTDDGEE